MSYSFGASVNFEMFLPIGIESLLRRPNASNSSQFSVENPNSSGTGFGPNPSIIENITPNTRPLMAP